MYINLKTEFKVKSGSLNLCFPKVSICAGSHRVRGGLDLPRARDF